MRKVREMPPPDFGLFARFSEDRIGALGLRAGNADNVVVELTAMTSCTCRNCCHGWVLFTE